MVKHAEEHSKLDDVAGHAEPQLVDLRFGFPDVPKFAAQSRAAWREQRL